MRKFDYLVIGAGAANIVTDAAIDSGKTVAIIEKDRFGGTCLNRGCIPTKSLITPLDYKQDFERLKSLGLVEGEFKINYDKLKERTLNHSQKHSQLVLDEYQNEENVTVFQGEAFFTGEKTLQVRLNDGTLSEELTAENIVIANGAKTRVPDDIQGIQDIDYLTSEKFFGDSFPDKPFKSLTILGGGVIAAEFAHFFS
ncbi:MAG: NAD(P)/FAD-dependent oxidoreductase, partial [Clostridiaceae bacterium]|nr:NAD(P)/FAD-dependent oxidoreductase [Clostridiaceae bacterium]